MNTMAGLESALKNTMKSLKYYRGVLDETGPRTREYRERLRMIRVLEARAAKLEQSLLDLDAERRPGRA